MLEYRVARIAGIGLLGLVAAGCAGPAQVAHQDTRSVARITADATITSQVNAGLIGNSRIESFGIDVDTYNGVVTLSGSVPDAAMAAAAVQTARAVKGVKQVISNLHVETD